VNFGPAIGAIPLHKDHYAAFSEIGQHMHNGFAKLGAVASLFLLGFGVLTTLIWNGALAYLLVAWMVGR
jgi:hypothetical protein